VPQKQSAQSGVERSGLDKLFDVLICIQEFGNSADSDVFLKEYFYEQKTYR
jgi:hypothetical protein